MTRILRAWRATRAKVSRGTRRALPDVLALIGVGCAAAGLALVHPTLALLLLGGYLYWIGSSIAPRRS